MASHSALAVPGHRRNIIRMPSHPFIELLLETLDAFRRPERFESFLLACMADMRGRTGFEQRPYPQADYLRSVRSTAAAVTLDRSLFAGLTGAEIGERVRRARLAAIEAVKAAGVSDKGTG